MIAPQMATMIAVVCTDAAIPPPVLARALRSAMDASFHALVVDGDMSTNDASSRSPTDWRRTRPIGEPGPDYESFMRRLTDVCAELARDIAADGEGATKLLDRGDHPGARAPPSPGTSAKAIAGSPLVKTAIFGADPNWGRVLATVGARAGTPGLALDPEKAEVRIQGLASTRTAIPRRTTPRRSGRACGRPRWWWRWRSPRARTRRPPGAATSATTT